MLTSYRYRGAMARVQGQDVVTRVRCLWGLPLWPAGTFMRLSLPEQDDDDAVVEGEWQESRGRPGQLVPLRFSRVSALLAFSRAWLGVLLVLAVPPALWVIASHHHAGVRVAMFLTLPLLAALWATACFWVGAPGRRERWRRRALRAGSGLSAAPEELPRDWAETGRRQLEEHLERLGLERHAAAWTRQRVPDNLVALLYSHARYQAAHRREWADMARRLERQLPRVLPARDPHLPGGAAPWLGAVALMATVLALLGAAAYGHHLAQPERRTPIAARSWQRTLAAVEAGEPAAIRNHWRQVGRDFRGRGARRPAPTPEQTRLREQWHGELIKRLDARREDFMTAVLAGEQDLVSVDVLMVEIGGRDLAAPWRAALLEHADTLLAQARDGARPLNHLDHLLNVTGGEALDARWQPLRAELVAAREAERLARTYLLAYGHGLEDYTTSEKHLPNFVGAFERKLGKLLRQRLGEEVLLQAPDELAADQQALARGTINVSACWWGVEFIQDGHEEKADLEPGEFLLYVPTGVTVYLDFVTRRGHSSWDGARVFEFDRSHQLELGTYDWDLLERMARNYTYDLAEDLTRELEQYPGYDYHPETANLPPPPPF